MWHTHNFSLNNVCYNKLYFIHKWICIRYKYIYTDKFYEIAYYKKVSVCNFQNNIL